MITIKREIGLTGEDSVYDLLNLVDDTLLKIGSSLYYRVFKEQNHQHLIKKYHIMVNWWSLAGSNR